MIDKYDIAEYSELLNALYLGASEEDPFSLFLTRIRDVMGLNFASITLRQPAGLDGGLLFVSGDSFEKTYIDKHDNVYTNEYFAVDPMSNLPLNQVITLQDIISEDVLEQSAFYKFCMEPFDLHYDIGIDLNSHNDKLFSVRFCRPKSFKPFTQKDKDFIYLIAPHMQRAVSSAAQLTELESERKFLATAISGDSIGTVSLDKSGEIIKANAEAKRIFKLKDGLSELNNRLFVDNWQTRKNLDELIKGLSDRQHEKELLAANAIAIPRKSGHAGFELVIKPLSVDRQSETKSSPYLMVFIRSPQQKTAVSVDSLINLYQLTLTEAKLTSVLVEGKSINEISAELGITRNTARAHLRSIFLKTGVTRQAMLVSLVLKSLAASPVSSGSLSSV
jgi:DNA-binding CsgD family transcriptional regulator/PAS domain-containing protein